MLIDGVENTNRKEVEWKDDGKAAEPYLILKIGDVDLLEKLIKFMKQESPNYGENIEVEYRELDRIRLEKRKEYGDLPVPQYVINDVTEKLVEQFIDPVMDRECEAYDVQEEYDEIQKKDWDLPSELPDEILDEILRDVKETISERTNAMENDDMIARQSYWW